MREFWPNKISNQVLRERTQTQTIEESIKLRRYIVHVLRKGKEMRKIKRWPSFEHLRVNEREEADDQEKSGQGGTSGWLS